MVWRIHTKLGFGEFATVISVAEAWDAHSNNAACRHRAALCDFWLQEPRKEQVQVSEVWNVTTDQNCFSPTELPLK